MAGVCVHGHGGDAGDLCVPLAHPTHPLTPQKNDDLDYALVASVDDDDAHVDDDACDAADDGDDAGLSLNDPRSHPLPSPHTRALLN